MFSSIASPFIQLIFSYYSILKYSISIPPLLIFYLLKVII
nr:MAG TPA: hypothetical protein [Caudoviricetes sp.]